VSTVAVPLAYWCYQRHDDDNDDIGVGAGGDRGIGPPLSGLGIIPTFCSNIGKKYQNMLRIA